MWFCGTDFLKGSCHFKPVSQNRGVLSVPSPQNHAFSQIDGKPTELAWGVVFPPDSAAGVYARQIAANFPVEAVALHPTQLYASFFGMVTLLFLLLFRNKLTKRGSTFGALLMLYGTFRFTLDFFRFYEGNMRVLLDLSLNQWISLGMFGVGLFFVLRRTNVKTVPVALSQSGQK